MGGNGWPRHTVCPSHVALKFGFDSGSGRVEWPQSSLTSTYKKCVQVGFGCADAVHTQNIGQVEGNAGSDLAPQLFIGRRVEGEVDVPAYPQRAS